MSNKLRDTTFSKKEQIYVIKINSYEKLLYKIGRSKNMNNRIKTYKTGRKNLDIVYSIECHNCKLVEKILKYKLKSHKYDKNKELFVGPLKIIIQTIKKTINELEKGRQLNPTEKILYDSEKELKDL